MKVRHLVGVLVVWIIMVGTITHFTASAGVGDDPLPKTLPACIEEDGSTQKECMWDDGSGLIVHNWDWGKHYSTYSRASHVSR